MKIFCTRQKMILIKTATGTPEENYWCNKAILKVSTNYNKNIALAKCNCSTIVHCPPGKL